VYESEFEKNLYQQRRDKLQQIAALGQQSGLSHAQATYPNSYAASHTIPELRAAYDHLTAEQLEIAPCPIEVSIAGRIMAIRVQGKAGFAQLQQGGQRFQIYVRKDDVGENAFALYMLLDLGDHIGVRGHLFRTRTGELTIHAAPIHELPAITFLAKAMLALPDKYHGLEDTELRYRQRYVDLFMNTGAAKPTTNSGGKGAGHKEAGHNEPGGKEVSHKEVSGKQAASKEASGNEAGSNEAGSKEAGSKEASGKEASSKEASGKGVGDNEAVILSEAKNPRISPEAAQPSPETTELETPNVREVFVKRAAILRAIRKFFDSLGYLEVETPMMHQVAGGAAAQPFTTHHNALDMDLFLRIAPELYLKRLVVGGLDRVYEINRNFRNEGVSTRHNPEFTMLEFYQAYANYHDLMRLTEELIIFVAKKVNGTTITHFNGHEIDLSKWKKYSMREAIIKFWPSELGVPPRVEDFAGAETLNNFLSEVIRTFYGNFVDGTSLKASAPQKLGPLGMRLLGVHSTLRSKPVGNAIAELFEALAEEHLIQPTIIYDFPLAVSPLSKKKPDEPDWVERFEFYIGGFEVGNAFSELNDPDDQRARFEAQMTEKNRGDNEAMDMDEDYVRALGYGLPPTAGEGIGIDRLTMLLTNSKSIRDVILFPLLRPQAKQSSAAEAPHGESAE
jgi:lysyl-tRNA synthetase, class II